MCMIKCSVIIPIYNPKEERLVRCLKCFDNIVDYIEVVLINDGSVEKILGILKYYAMHNEQIRLISQLNSGVSNARNRGVSEAKGKYVVFCDADDELNVEELQKAIDDADERDADFVFSDYYKISQNSQQTVQLDIINNPDAYMRKMLCLPNKYGTVWAKVFSKALIDENEVRFDNTLSHGEDSLFLIDYLNCAKKVMKSGRNYYKYYVYEDSVSKINPKAINGYLLMLHTGKSKIMENGTDLLPEYYNFCVVNLLIMLVNYIFPKNCKYMIGKSVLEKVLKDDLIKDSLKGYKESGMDILYRIAAFCMEKRIIFACYLISTIRNRSR